MLRLRESPSTRNGVTAKKMLIAQWLFLPHSVELTAKEISGSEFYFRNMYDLTVMGEWRRLLHTPLNPTLGGENPRVRYFVWNASYFRKFRVLRGMRIQRGGDGGRTNTFSSRWDENWCLRKEREKSKLEWQHWSWTGCGPIVGDLVSMYEVFWWPGSMKLDIQNYVLTGLL